MFTNQSKWYESCHGDIWLKIHTTVLDAVDKREFSFRIRAFLVLDSTKIFMVTDHHTWYGHINYIKADSSTFYGCFFFLAFTDEKLSNQNEMLVFSIGVELTNAKMANAWKMKIYCIKVNKNFYFSQNIKIICQTNFAGRNAMDIFFEKNSEIVTSMENVLIFNTYEINGTSFDHKFSYNWTLRLFRDFLDWEP